MSRSHSSGVRHFSLQMVVRSVAGRGSAFARAGRQGVRPCLIRPKRRAAGCSKWKKKINPKLRALTKKESPRARTRYLAADAPRRAWVKEIAAIVTKTASAQPRGGKRMPPRLRASIAAANSSHSGVSAKLKKWFGADR